MPALILMYHDLSDTPELVPPEHQPYVLTTATFRRQMEAIVASKLTVLTISQWKLTPQPSGALALTFDDGHVSNHDLILPILFEYRLTATFFITAGLIGTGTTMDWQQLRALHAAGMEIGSHTLTHRLPSTLNDDELRHELLESRRILEDGLGAPVTSISSPTGFFNPRMRDIAREVGYRSLCFGQIGLAADDGDPFSLHRVAVKSSMEQDTFNALLRFERGTIRRLRLRQSLLELARKILRPNAYVRIRRMFLEGGMGIS